MPVKQINQGWRVHTDGWVINPKGQFFRGHFKRNSNNSNGGKPKWYWMVRLGNRATATYVHHLIADSFVENKYPDVCKHIDHINGDSLDNRTSNLRFVTPEINLLNQKSNPTRRKNRFEARACGKYIGTFDTEHEARAATKKFKDNKEIRLWEAVKKAQFEFDTNKPDVIMEDVYAFVD